MELAHEVLSRLGRTSAADRWRDDLERKTAPLARSFLQKLKRLEKQYGMRLPGVSDRLSEKFVKPLLLDRILALVKPAVRDARLGVESTSFASLSQESDEYLATTLGSALEPQPWLQALEEEIQSAEAEVGSFGEMAQAISLAPARVPIDVEDIRRQLSLWEKPLEDK
jgi:hypothetical protein